MLKIADKEFSSRLFTGTGKFANSQLMAKAITASGSQLATMALKRVDITDRHDDILSPLVVAGIHLLPNTSGGEECTRCNICGSSGSGGARYSLAETGNSPRP